MVLALGAVSLAFVLVSRAVHGSASLGAVTVVPIVLVTGLVIGGMALLSVPLTLLTALLMSLVVGLGIDYNIHVADRFARELAAGRDLFGAIETAVTSTGGALLGSALTTSVAFASITLHPTPQLQNFGTLVVLAMVAAFAVSVFVLPSLLALWGRYVAPEDATAGAAGVEGTPADD
jgi:predicted RND superfamily exporter protein